MPFLNNGENIDMPELFDRLMKLELKVVACPIHEYWIDIGRPETLEEAYLTWDN